MELIKGISRRSLFWTIFFMGLLCALADTAMYFAIHFTSGRLSALNAEAGLPDYQKFVADAGNILEMVNQFYLPVSIGIFLLFALLLWLCSHFSFANVIKRYGLTGQAAKAEKPQKPKTEPDREKEINDQRMFLHILSVLQREGRLMDFFSEDLEPYQDDQIGAAVRNIHENCKKIIARYLVSEPILKEEEEQEITVSAGFDPNAIKLTGNVTGNPPFKGIVRHRGWRARKMEMPSLAGTLDPSVISPAEVEIL